MVRGRRRFRISGTTRAAVLWFFIMLPLAFWGLPSAREDATLFGGATPWPAERYGVADDLAARQTRNAGADTDLDPLQPTDALVDLTATDRERAAVLRRYRLFSRQPDEMITFLALQRMRPRALDFDPRLYQYGGGYIYLIGAALGTSAVFGATTLTTNAGTYLTQPDLFGQFYVVARCVSLLFGVLTLIAAAKLARRAGGRSAGWIALLCIAASPVFITASLEAKPHLPSACMMLWAMLTALDYVRRERIRDLVLLGLQAGYAFGLVLTGLAAAFLWPVLLLLRPRRWQLLLAAGGIAVATYCATNPYVAINWITGNPAFSSNLDNSTAMYADQFQHAATGAARVAVLMYESVGPGVLLMGLVGGGLLLRRQPRATLLAVLPGLALLLLAVALAAGKPAEFARFLLVPALLLCMGTGIALQALAARRPMATVAVLVIVLGTMGTPAYIRSFATDARLTHESRFVAAQWIAANVPAEATLGVIQEPAPYAIPPVDFTTRQVVLVPATRPADLQAAALPAVLVFTADDDETYADAWWQAFYRLRIRFPDASVALSPITWANKPVFIYERAP